MNELFRLVHLIRHMDLEPIDREMLRPVFAAHDGGEICHVPAMVEKVIRKYAGRTNGA
ncbi:conserved protein of unknown function [Pararobbsia alpina]|uniref:hypothetical protein n=1 Tax=Pararobbsia alpina TaxID=621374 RepID=UPI0039A60602